MQRILLLIQLVRHYRQTHPTRFNIAIGLLAAMALSFLFFRTGFVALLLLGIATAAAIAYLFFFAGPATQPQAAQPPQATQPLVYDPRTIVPDQRPDIMTPLQWFFATEGAKGPHFGVLAALITALIPMALLTLLFGWVGLIVGGALGGFAAAHVWNNGVLIVEPNTRALLTVNEIRVAGFEIGESIVWLPRIYPFLFNALPFDMSEREEKMPVQNIEARKGGRVSIGLEYGWRPARGHLNSFYEFQRSDAQGIRKLFQGTTDNATLLFVSSYEEAKELAVGGTREKLARFVRKFAMKQANGIDPAYKKQGPGDLVDDIPKDIPTFRPALSLPA